MAAKKASGRSVIRDADRLLLRLVKGGCLRRMEDGTYRLGRQGVSNDLVKQLVAADLLRELAAGRVDLSPAGASRGKRVRLRQRLRSQQYGEDTPATQDAFRAQHQLQETQFRGAREGHARRTVNRGESLLGWLRQRRDRHGRPFIGDDHVAAGERLRMDFETAGLSPKVTASWTGMPVEKKRHYRLEMDPSTAQLAARERFHKAVDGLGPDLADVAVRICCFHEGLDTVEKEHGWPVRSGKVALKLALERLAAHYGLDRRPQTHTAHRDAR